MDILSLFTSLQGRINRARYWIGVIALALVSMLGTAAVVSVFDVSDTSVKLTVLIAFLLLYPTYAVMAKRFQDRDKPGWTALFALVPMYGINFMQTFGSIGREEAGIVSTLLDLVVVGLWLWLLIELGILKGTPGPNRFGPDPLGQIKNDAAL